MRSKTKADRDQFGRIASSSDWFLAMFTSVVIGVRVVTLDFVLRQSNGSKITDYISCNSKNLIYLIQCKKCHSQYIGEAKRKLNERFGEHRRSILNHHQLLNPTPVSLHFNQTGHSINDVQLILLELIRSKRDSVRKAREAHLINKAKTLHPLGINRRDETRQ